MTGEPETAPEAAKRLVQYFNLCAVSEQSDDDSYNEIPASATDADGEWVDDTILSEDWEPWDYSCQMWDKYGVACDAVMSHQRREELRAAVQISAESYNAMRDGANSEDN